MLPNHDPTKGAHRLANQSPTTERIERWRSHVSPAQIAVVERISKEAMLRYNYSLSVAQ